MIDEIYTESSLQYKSEKIVGFAENDSNVLSKTVLAFMIKSSFGKYKEICKLIPVKNLKADDLLKMTNNVISFVQNIGFHVICLITDNNRINQKLFKQLTGEKNSFPNPVYKNYSIFCTYDPVHLYKNFRNNWINLKNLDKTFVYPDFNSLELIKESFEHFLHTLQPWNDRMLD